MALTVTISQISSTQAPGIGFYSVVSYDNTGFVYDATANTLISPASATSSHIAFTESTPGTWSWTKNFSALPDGFYTIKTWESTQNLVAAADFHVYLVGGETLESVASTQVPLTSDTGGTNALAYYSPSGDPILGATVRIYTNSDWTAQALANPVGVTTTDGTGRWTQPVFVSSGATYVIQYQLPGSYGPDTVSVTV